MQRVEGYFGRGASVRQLCHEEAIAVTAVSRQLSRLLISRGPASYEKVAKET